MATAAARRAPEVQIQITFKGLLAYHLWREYPNASSDEIEARAKRLLLSPSLRREEAEERAWEKAIANRVRRGF